MNIFNWLFGERLQPPKPKTEGLDLRTLAAIAMVTLIVALLSALIFLLYSFAAKTQSSDGQNDTQQEPLMFGDLKQRPLKRWKVKKAGKKKKKKAQMLEEANRKWHEMYGSDNSDYEEKKDLRTVPLGSMEMIAAKRVSFRDTIKDVYLIENKEEMKRLERLRKSGYDVTIRRHHPSVCDISREHALNDTYGEYFDENTREHETKCTYSEDLNKEHTSSTQLLDSCFDRHVNSIEHEHVLPKMLESCPQTSDFKEEGYLTVDKEGSLNRTLDEKEKV